MEPSLWSLERRGHDDRVAVLSFYRPPRNFMSFLAMSQLEELLSAIARDDSVWVVVITGGVPRYFIAHADLDDLVRLGRGETYEGDPRSWGRTLRLIEAMPQPVVAALNGQAWGGGNELALACAMRVAAASATLAQPEVNVGIIPGAGGTQRLPRLIGPARAADVVLSGRTIDAATAHSWGWVNAVLPDEAFLEHALAWIHPITIRPRSAVVAAKRALVDGAKLALEDGLKVEGRLFRDLQLAEPALHLQEAAIRRYRTASPSVTVEL